MESVNFSFREKAPAALRKQMVEKIQKWPEVRTASLLDPTAKSRAVRFQAFAYLKENRSVQAFIRKLQKLPYIATADEPSQPYLVAPVASEHPPLLGPSWLADAVVHACPSVFILSRGEEVAAFKCSGEDREFVEIVTHNIADQFDFFYKNSKECIQLQKTANLLRVLPGRLEDVEGPLSERRKAFTNFANDLLALAQTQKKSEEPVTDRPAMMAQAI